MAALPYPAYKITVGLISAAPSGINSTRQKSTGFISTCGN
ncbi:hypothetical protein HMPREF3212_00935 [Citrobacter freundii]|uniref:Uncharacterized protein n=1 Tax=Citrobacter freundii TaxID=546 RepID=A0A133LL21_CITFR|nr:hypothetical protein AB07_1294 [Citrobacter freundii]KWZ92544.1 hypothetical protein HMPREF3212_00935 [Citrobacter freundii]CDL36855.1 hypothetical protein [Citrobacter freundii]